MLARLFEQRSQSRVGQFDRQVVAEASLDDLDPRLADRFRGQISGDDRITALSKLDMIREDDEGVLRPTVAGVLLGTRQPQRWLPHAYIQEVAYRGASIGEALDSPRYQLDAKDNDGPLDEQIAYGCRFVARNQRVEASKSMGRLDWPQYDLTAIFEAVVNAVAHRDYSLRGSKVRLRMFSDRLELFSPGALVNGMSIDEISLQAEYEEPRDRQPPRPMSGPGRNRDPASDDDGPPRRGSPGHSRTEPTALGQTTGVPDVRRRVAIDDLRRGSGCR